MWSPKAISRQESRDFLSAKAGSSGFVRQSSTLASEFRICYHRPMLKIAETPRSIDWSELNDEQKQAVFAPFLPLMIIAGAGSGKTRTLVYRIAHYISQGHNPSSIVLVTFTNRAAAHMGEALIRLGGENAALVKSGTFHGLALDYLRRFSIGEGARSSFSLLSKDDAMAVLKLTKAERFLDQKRLLPTSQITLKALSLSLNTFTPLETVVEQQFPQWFQSRMVIAQLARAYMAKKQQMSLMDFDDVLVNFYDLLLRNELAREQIAREVSFVLVDEFQDTNRLQAEIVDLLCPANKNLTVVGDDAQCIYGFRGSRIENMLEFKERYADAKVISLKTNYRSTGNIIHTANVGLTSIRQGFSKTLCANKRAGEKVRLLKAESVEDQSRTAVRVINEAIKRGQKFADIAILYRAHAHASEIRHELIQQQIPFNMISARDEKDEPCGDRVTLSSVHQAKGLEWKEVIVIWLAEGKFPLEVGKQERQLDEERRLFYVAITRAKEHLTLLYPSKGRLKNGEPVAYFPSRFLEQIRNQVSLDLSVPNTSNYEHD